MKIVPKTVPLASERLVEVVRVQGVLMCRRYLTI